MEILLDVTFEKTLPESVERILKTSSDLTHKINDLESQRDDLLRSDRKYAEYLDHYAVYGKDDSPLSLRAFYEMSAEWDAIHAELNRLWNAKQMDDYNALCEKYTVRLNYLEVVFAA